MIPADQLILQTPKIIDVHDHFHFTNTSVGASQWIRETANSGTGAIQTSISGRPGLWRLTTGTASASGLSRVRTATAFNIGNLNEFLFEVSYSVPSIANGTQDANWIFGILDGQTSTINSGIYFQTNFTTYTNQLQCICRNTSGAATITASGTTVATSTFYDLAIKYKSGVGVNFYINGSPVTTINTNLPPTGTLLNPIALVNKSVGTGTSRTCDLDIVRFRALLT